MPTASLLAEEELAYAVCPRSELLTEIVLLLDWVVVTIISALTLTMHKRIAEKMVNAHLNEENFCMVDIEISMNLAVTTSIDLYH